MDYTSTFDKRVTKAKQEALRFLEAVEAYEKKEHSTSPESAAVKRSSMDLTRSLAQVRKGNW